MTLQKNAKSCVFLDFQKKT